ncbi:hypothetical protein G7085_00305 [Tessaracoccus sp. HDW20]|uniref:hypothetical protein n=1 Tax=Tessaracoccus coleopterorum TaxID=2714950 RepID=UPI0018D434B5|nr:hypothetical protein [Tessaracoccus coleopterorum]NHB83664.1 hypothetical protein [Tessaracoccus coleopterorum]
MTSPRVRPLTNDQNRHFAAWCATALNLMPYMAPMLYTLRPVTTTTTPYAAVDRHGRLYLNIDNIAAEGVRFGAEVLLHECSHILADHFTQAELANATGIAGREGGAR